MKPNYPQRIICLTEETTETIYAIGASDLIIGITQYTLRPPQAKKEKELIFKISYNIIECNTFLLFVKQRG
ncbi:MAG: hypothetical protein NTW25_13300 [Candidatus Kapabacteria bacterium]|nr:hypothetical protein [Candidatus Kapabacteria bacterium]